MQLPSLSTNISEGTPLVLLPAPRNCATQSPPSGPAARLSSVLISPATFSILLGSLFHEVSTEPSAWPMLYTPMAAFRSSRHTYSLASAPLPVASTIEADEPTFCPSLVISPFSLRCPIKNCSKLPSICAGLAINTPELLSLYSAIYSLPVASTLIR